MKWLVVVTGVAALVSAGCGGAKKETAQTMEEYGYTETQSEIFFETLTKADVDSRGASTVCAELYEQAKDNEDFPPQDEIEYIDQLGFTNGCLDAMLEEGWGKK